MVFFIDADQRVASLQQCAQSPSRGGQLIVEAEGFSGWGKGTAIERERAEPNCLAGLIHRLVGGEVCQVNRSTQLHLALEGDRGLVGLPAFLPSLDDHVDRPSGGEPNVGRNGDPIDAGVHIGDR